MRKVRQAIRREELGAKLSKGEKKLLTQFRRKHPALSLAFDMRSFRRLRKMGAPRNLTKEQYSAYARIRRRILGKHPAFALELREALRNQKNGVLLHSEQNQALQGFRKGHPVAAFVHSLYTNRRIKRRIRKGQATAADLRLMREHRNYQRRKLVGEGAPRVLDARQAMRGTKRGEDLSDEDKKVMKEFRDHHPALAFVHDLRSYRRLERQRRRAGYLYEKDWSKLIDLHSTTAVKVWKSPPVLAMRESAGTLKGAGGFLGRRMVTAAHNHANKRAAYPNPPRHYQMKWFRRGRRKPDGSRARDHIVHRRKPLPPR